MIDQYLRSRSDLGISNAIAARIMIAKNPFATESTRKPQAWFVLLAAILFTLIFAFVYFNLSN